MAQSPIALISVMSDAKHIGADGANADKGGLTLGPNAIGLYAGAGAPTFAAPIGSLYLRTDGSSTSTRLYTCSVAAGTWVAITTAS